MKPGEYILLEQEIALNADTTFNQLIIENTGDRPIQVGSHFHFYEANSLLKNETITYKEIKSLVPKRLENTVEIKI